MKLNKIKLLSLLFVSIFIYSNSIESNNIQYTISTSNIKIVYKKYTTPFLGDEIPKKHFVLHYDWQIKNNTKDTVIISRYSKCIYDKKEKELIVEYYSLNSFPKDMRISSAKAPFEKLEKNKSKIFKEIKVIDNKNIKVDKIKIIFWIKNGEELFIKKTINFKYRKNIWNIF